MRRSLQLVSVLLILALAVTVFTIPAVAQAANDKPAAHQVTAKWGLSFDLEYNKSAQRLDLTVKNNYYWPVYLTFASGKKFDFAVFDKNGKRVWRHSDDQFYTQATTGLWMYRGQTKTFKAKLPDLKPGNYTVKAYFYAWGNNSPVASIKINVPQKPTPQPNPIAGLKVDAWYKGGSQPHIVLALNNQSKKDITLKYPTGKRYDVVLFGDNGYYWQYSDDKHNDKPVRSEELKAGVYRSLFIYLPEKLPRGNYTAYVYFLDSSYFDLVKAVKFKV